MFRDCSAGCQLYSSCVSFLCQAIPLENAHIIGRFTCSTLESAVYSHWSIWQAELLSFKASSTCMPFVGPRKLIYILPLSSSDPLDGSDMHQLWSLA